MAAEVVSAWFLHKRASGDTSLRVSFFTREHGIVEALYKGGRTPKKQAIIQPFTPFWLVLNVSNDWYYVNKLECESHAFVLPGLALFSGLYVNEILYSMLKPHDACATLFSAYVRTIESLATASCRFTVEPILRRFERALLNSTGYALSLTHEAESGALINPDQMYQFMAGVGLISAKNGLLGAHILAIADDKLDDSNTLRTAKIIHREAIAHAMDGKVIKTRALYH